MTRVHCVCARRKLYKSRVNPYAISYSVSYKRAHTHIVGPTETLYDRDGDRDFGFRK